MQPIQIPNTLVEQAISVTSKLEIPTAALTKEIAVEDW